MRTQQHQEKTPHLSLLPAKPGTCAMCATEHGPREPHNAVSLFYQFRFKIAHGRWGTWADAVAHLSAADAEIARQAVEACGITFTQPEGGAEPIAELFSIAPSPPVANPQQ